MLIGSKIQLTSATVLMALVSARTGATILGRSSGEAICDGAEVVSSTTISVNGKEVVHTTYSCPSIARRGIICRLLGICPTKPKPAPTDLPTYVCDQLCDYVCSDPNPLPPITEDCGVIQDAIQIYEGSIAPTFVVDASSIEQLTYGTCRFFFENLSSAPLEYCWTSLSSIASSGETACFPPVQPVQSQALCIPSTGAWEVGVGHS
ncbi:hypothetical protein SERLA73DRAFT_184203 [Serpula lacrymans var. lacrymans S7.3]|uniref:Uncharacterized protein n=2 Tax=Serpula lacrymans var. lacrymans TaxID=341189 RepID=F8Q2R8_SERL3|nr:uncharacterized protein SERLADRAFT_471769 [Serpula lacrymans var. lacrymans S7.9]EGN97479.1 hypothetical protein SERLA73DRAFT_184203 [Serpula lacrymans var. lacrymans S7.3]EGO23076.1 hypothetical protein SERLADRAFT_471769 [Serpula lacrymans var. lacrymans S7.9]